MQVFKSRIQGIAQSKALAKAFNKAPKVGYKYLTKEQQESLILALVNEDEDVRAHISNIIDGALLDAYYDEVGNAEAEEDREEYQRMIADDNRERARDMRLSMG
jgi:hypothetical protein